MISTALNMSTFILLQPSTDTYAESSQVQHQSSLRVSAESRAPRPFSRGLECCSIVFACRIKLEHISNDTDEIASEMSKMKSQVSGLEFQYVLVNGYQN